MQVIETASGYAVTNNDSIIAGPFATHAAAWRWIDRHEGEPISRAEHVSEWIVGKILAA
jgi:hypothetical protein